MAGVAVSQSVRVAGDAMNLAVQHYLREVFRLEVGENTAENVKKILGAALPQNNGLRLEVSGKDLVYGGPRVVTVTEGDICEALHDPVQAVVETVLRTLEQAPPALAADVYDNGLLMAGGGALLRGLDQCIARATHLKVAVDKDPLTTVLGRHRPCCTAGNTKGFSSIRAGEAGLSRVFGHGAVPCPKGTGTAPGRDGRRAPLSAQPPRSPAGQGGRPWDIVSC